jgi:pilus assembly protein CpaD
MSGRYVMRLRLAAVDALSLGLMACDHYRDDHALYVALNDPAQRHPIIVAPSRVSSELPLPGPQHEDISGFRAEATRMLRAYRKEGEGRLALVVPAGQRHSPGVREALRQIHKLAAEAGVSSTRIDVHADQATPHSIRMSYQRYRPLPPECGDWSEDVTRNRQNLTLPNLGCASQRNLAAMVANPDDLMHSRAETPRESERRDPTWSSYVKAPGGRASNGSGLQGTGAGKQ